MSHACTLSRRCPVRSDSAARFAGSYFSVPQIREYHSIDVNDMKNAVASIPAYIERCSHCAPPACVHVAPQVDAYTSHHNCV